MSEPSRPLMDIIYTPLGCQCMYSSSLSRALCLLYAVLSALPVLSLFFRGELWCPVIFTSRYAYLICGDWQLHLFCFALFLRGGWIEILALLKFPLVYSSIPNKHVILVKTLSLLRSWVSRKVTELPLSSLHFEFISSPKFLLGRNLEMLKRTVSLLLHIVICCHAFQPWIFTIRAVHKSQSFLSIFLSSQTLTLMILCP